jgi:hypothetical protein
MSHYADSSGGARARSRVQSCQSIHNHSIGLDPVGELSDFPLVPCPDCGMARVVEGRVGGIRNLAFRMLSREIVLDSQA